MKKRSSPGRQKGIEKVKLHSKTVLLCLGVALGICLTVYPLLASRASDRAAGSVTADYREEAQTRTDTAAQLADAEAWNAMLAEAVTNHTDTPAGYEDLLWLTEDGMMGYVSIPKIGIELPIYHGTSTGVLEKGVGHLPTTSLPVGGESTHAVLSAHSGMSGARMFTDLEQLSVGDLFTVRVLDRELTYQVDHIATVLPQETALLEIQAGEDLCTLVTCTPYGVNTHRLLVRGRRVEAAEVPQDTIPAQQEPAPSTWAQKYLLYIAVGTAVGLITGGILLFLKIKNTKKQGR